MLTLQQTSQKFFNSNNFLVKTAETCLSIGITSTRKYEFCLFDIFLTSLIIFNKMYIKWMFRAQLRRKESGGGEKEVVGYGDDHHLARRAAAKHSGGGGQGGVEGEEGGVEEELGGHHGEGGGGGQCHHPSLDWGNLN